MTRARKIAITVDRELLARAERLRRTTNESRSAVSVVNCDWLVTIRKERLSEPIGTLSTVKLEQLDSALRFSLGLDEA